MRDLGVFTSVAISSSELVEFVRAFAMRDGQPFEKRSEESVVGTPPDVLYIFDTTAPNEGYFSDDEKAVIQSKLGCAPEGYVSIHFASGDGAFGLAERMAREVVRAWKGLIDYRGAGGQLSVPPVAPPAEKDSGD